MTILAHAGAINNAEVDFVDVAILVLITLAHLQVAIRGWQANSEPVSLSEVIPHLEARYLYTEVGTDDSKRLGRHPGRRGSQSHLLKALVLTAPLDSTFC